MATATVYIGNDFLNSDVGAVFLPELEKVLTGFFGYKVLSQIARTDLAQPNIFISLDDFGNMKHKTVGEMMEAAKKLTRQHFGFSDEEIEIEFSGKHVL